MHTTGILKGFIVFSDVQEHTDLVDALMSFLGHIAKKNSKLYCHPQCNILGLFQAGKPVLHASVRHCYVKCIGS